MRGTINDTQNGRIMPMLRITPEPEGSGCGLIMTRLRLGNGGGGGVVRNEDIM